MVESYSEMKLAVIGASSGQLPICLKAKEMGIEVYCFSWPKDAICKDVVDKYYPISILEKDLIVEKCRGLHVDGVVSNASDLTAEVVAYVAEKLGLNGTPFRVLEKLRDKFVVRQLSNKIQGLSKLSFYKYEGIDKKIYPCVVKPCIGSAKSGVSFANNFEEFSKAIQYAIDSSESDIIVEEFIEGKEFSVESISYKGEHYVLQITEKDSSSSPHFVELGHHQPANISNELRNKIVSIVTVLLKEIGYTNGASHVELKIKGEEIFLIEVNLRGGGDNISNVLVQLSSGYDYLRSMIEVSLGTFNKLWKISEPAYAGIYYLCKQTEQYLSFFKNANKEDWFVDGEIKNINLKESHSNYERDGYLIYKSNHKIIPKEINI